MKFVSILVLAFSVSTFAYAQSPELSAMNTTLQKAIGPVQASSKTYEPKYAFLQPAVIQYSYDEIDAKANNSIRIAREFFALF